MAEQPAPAVEMLWETSDPGDVLRTRFGFHDEVEAGRWVTTTLEARWGVRVDRCERIVMSGPNALAWLRTSSGRMLTKWSVAPERFAGLAALAQLTSWLDARGLPVSAPVPALDGRLQLQVGRVSVGVQREVEGGLLETSDDGMVRAAGAVLARLHAALAEFPDAGSLADLPSSPAPLRDRITRWLDACPGHVPPIAREALRRLVADASTDLPAPQIVHGDYRSANIICGLGGVAAVIDFETARLDHRIDELARSAVLLGTRFRDWAPFTKHVRATFLAGYQSEQGLTSAEASWWDPLVLWYSLTVTPAGPDPTGWGRAAMSQVDQPPQPV